MKYFYNLQTQLQTQLSRGVQEHIEDLSKQEEQLQVLTKEHDKLKQQLSEKQTQQEQYQESISMLQVD